MKSNLCSSYPEDGYDRPEMRVRSLSLRSMLLGTSFSAGSLTQDDSSDDFFNQDGD